MSEIPMSGFELSLEATDTRFNAIVRKHASVKLIDGQIRLCVGGMQAESVPVTPDEARMIAMALMRMADLVEGKRPR